MTLAQSELPARAEGLRRLHDGFLVLPNAWDAGSARALAALCFGAIATTSSGVSDSLGYADRQEATAAGRQAALDLQRMIDRGLRPADVETMLARGRHDPAFAVAFSEQLGVRGYVNVVGAIRMSYGEQNKVPVGGVRAAQALATTLTTALGTRVPPATPGGRAPVPDGDAHIGARFVGDLTGDFDPLGYRGHESGAKYVGPDAETDMSVLLRLSNPPPDIARQIGERRFRTILARTAERNPHSPAPM